MIKKIDGQTRLCGLIGNPIEHTLSPGIHNYLAERMGHNLVYLPFCVKDDIKGAVQGAYALNILGMNVTVPYKKAVMPFLAELDENAKEIGSVNTLVRTKDGFKGYNTDYLGLYRTMSEEKIEISGEKVIIIGAGGAAMPAAYLCAKEKAQIIYLCNRTKERAEAISKSVHQAFPQVEIIPLELQDYRKLQDNEYIAIQTTSVGLYPNCEQAAIEDTSFYKRIKQAVDIIYNPYETRFMKLVKKHGGTACNGLKMLLYQGISSYELWNQVTVPDTITEEILRLLEKELTTYA